MTSSAVSTNYISHFVCLMPLDLVLALKDMTAFADRPTGVSFLFDGLDQPATATMALVAEEG